MIKQTILDLLTFIKKPVDTQLNASWNSKLRIVFILLGFEILFLFIILFPLYYLISYFLNVHSKLDYKYDEFWFSIISTLFLAPFFEELSFRLILRRQYLTKVIFNQNIWNKIFPLLTYFTSIVFGFAHLSNFDNDETLFYIFSPIIIASQMIGGFVLAFIRVRFNIWWAMFCHFLWNVFATCLSVFWSYTFSYNENTPDYSISITESQFYHKEKGRNLKIDSTNGKLYRVEVNQYSFQHTLDTLYQKDKYYIDDAFIYLKFQSKKGITKDEFLKILQKEYDITK